MGRNPCRLRKKIKVEGSIFNVYDMKFNRFYTILSMCVLSAIASAQMWTDVTSLYVKNADFMQGNSCWQGTNFWNVNMGYKNAEYWNMNFTKSQEVTGLPAGRYRVTLYGFYRIGTSNNDYSLYTNNNYSNSQNATLYCNTSVNNYSTKLPPISSGASDTNYGGAATQVGNWMQRKYIPNDMASARYWFDQGYYKNTLEFQVGNDGMLTIGLEKNIYIQDDWSCFGDLKLEYYGTLEYGSAKDLIINEVMANNIDVFLDASCNYGTWFEVYNPTDKVIDLGGLYVSSDPANLRQHKLVDYYGYVAPHGYAVISYDHYEVFAPNSYRQINDKLDTKGGTIILSDGTTPYASVTYPAAMPRISYARKTDGGEEWGYTGNPTPEQSNNGGSFAQAQTATPTVSREGGLFEGTVSFSVTVPSGATLRYTLDGSTPTQTNGYISTNGHFETDRTATYRFRAFQEGMLPSNVVSRSFILNNGNEPFPIISVVTDPRHIFGSDIALFEPSGNGRPGNGVAYQANWNMDWDRPVNMEYITTDGKSVVNQECNMSVCGGWSRAWSPHSFKLKANKIYYDQNYFPYQFWKDKPFLKSKTLQIRNGGNDTGCRIKDAALQEIVARSGLYIDHQAWQPVHIYFNGEPYAVLNMREPNNKHYGSANYGIDTDEMDQFEVCPDSGYVQKEGTREAWERLYNLSKNAANADTYEEIGKLLDINEFINYLAVEFYIGNWDWPQNNVKAFRDQNDGKFRFVIFDLDGALNTTSGISTFMGKQNYTFDKLYGYDYSTSTSLTDKRLTKEIELVTIVKNLLNNAVFKKQLVDAMCIMGGSIYTPERVQSIVDEMAAYLSQGGYIDPSGTANTIKATLNKSWNSNVMDHIKSQSLTSAAKQQATFGSNIEGASITMNGMAVPTGKFDGYVYAPVTLEADAPAGYRFVGWKGLEAGSEKTIITSTDTWKYNDNGTSLDNTGWNSVEYDDNSWKSGAAPLGYGKNQTTNLTQNLQTYYFRKTIDLDETPASVSMDYVADDAFVVYVNGVEASRYNLPNGTITYNTNATTYAHNNPDAGTIALDASLFHKGTNVIAVEVHNFFNPGSSDILWQASIKAVTEGQTDYVSTDREYTLPESGTINVTAVWEKYTDDKNLRINRATPIKINEVSAENSMTMNDLFKKSDWVELYNTTDTDLDVTGLYISNNASKPQKYQLKGGDNINTIIPAKGYLVISCDNKVASAVSQLHASFKLDNNITAEPSEQLVMISSSEEFVANNQAYFDSHAIMREFTDTLFYDQHGGEQSVGRYPDGGMTYYVFDHPTPAATNIVEATDPYAGYDKLWVYEGTVLRGDANGDGEVGMPDVMFIVNYILGNPAATFDKEAADANQDGDIGMPDVMYIVNHILNGKFPDE